MNIEKCLKAMAMDKDCMQNCSEKKIYHFGEQKCNACCKMNAERALTFSERQVILFSMIYVKN